MLADLQPWFAAATTLLDVRRQDRLLVFSPGVDQARHLAALVGSRGALTVVTADRTTAGHLAALELPQVRVLCHVLIGDERFGSHDAMLVAPPHGPLLPPGGYVDVLRANLRPGGRFVVDVPGPDMVPELRAAWQDAGWPRDRFAKLQGIPDDALVEALRNGGLREVHGVLGSHLLPALPAADLVDAFAAAIGLTEAERLPLTHGLMRRCGTTGPAELLVHRTRLHGLR